MTDWKPWDGRKLPKRYENTIVVVRYQNGRESGPRAASWWARTFELDGITEEQVRTAVDDEIIRRLKEADEDHGE